MQLEKCTMGIQLDNIDMPISMNGIVPDIIINPHAIPSRMTVGQLMECIVGKAALLENKDADGTPFESFDKKEFEDILEKYGYNRSGKDYMINGMTGEKMEVEIFFGPMYYQRLKHMTQDKVHSRGHGLKTTLTRQAPEGRQRDGGLRIGEMERDALIGHGTSLFLKEKMVDNSDAYVAYVCNKCGLFAQRNEYKENKQYAQESDRYICTVCDNIYDISKVRCPYAFKLLIQILIALHMTPRIRTDRRPYA